MILFKGKQQPTPGLTADKIDLRKRATTAAALSVAAAGVFFALSQTSMSPIATAAADGKEVNCWGINGCKGKTACKTAFNGCAGKNSCKAKGYLKVSHEECTKKGGKLLKGSEGDPDKS